MTGAAAHGRWPLSVPDSTTDLLEREFDNASTSGLPPHGRSGLDQVETDAGRPGLVISAKTRRKATTAAPGFPSRDLVGVAAATLAATAGLPLWAGAEGPTWFVTVSPGSVRVGSVNLAKGQRSENRSQDRGVAEADLLASMADDSGNLPAESAGVSRLISAWSHKSRANMTRRLSTLDYNELVAAGTPVLVTLTYPADWLTVAPEGASVKKHLDRFRKRWIRRFDGPPVGVWKLEFQRRGAPHFHLLVARPAGCDSFDFRLWIAQTWASVVGHPDQVERSKHLAAGTRVDEEEAGRMSDPRRIGVYFSKHGLFQAKDYQNEPPEEWAGSSIGRMWGYWTLSPAEVAAPVTADQALDVARTLRRLHHRARFLRSKTVVRVEQSTGRVRLRTVRRPVHRMPGTRGFVTVNDGPTTAMLLDRVLAVGLGPAIVQALDADTRRLRLGMTRHLIGRLPA